MSRITLVAAAVLSVACAPNPVCTAEDLAAALASASPGDTVHIGECSIAGAFVVPDGVTLRGGTLVSVEGAAPLLTVHAVTDAAVEDIHLEVRNGVAGVRVDGGGRIALRDVTVLVERGIGIGIDATSATLTNVALHGPITAATAFSASSSPSETGAFGLATTDLLEESLTIEELEASGFGAAAVFVHGGVLEWSSSRTEPDVSSTAGFGVVLIGVDATLTAVTVVDVFSTAERAGVAIAASEGSHLVAEDLEVLAGDGYGLFAAGAAIELTRARFEGLGLSGVRMQGGTLVATQLTCRDDGGVGLLAINTAEVTVMGGMFEAQRSAPLVSGMTLVTRGDGIHVVRDLTDPLFGGFPPPLSVTLIDVALTGNEQVGLLVDAADGPVATLELTRVTTEAPEGGFGVVAQRTTRPITWDADVIRGPIADVNDDTFEETDAVGVMMPPGLPVPF